jgi:hypothetical protein
MNRRTRLREEMRRAFEAENAPAEPPEMTADSPDATPVAKTPEPATAHPAPVSASPEPHHDPPQSEEFRDTQPDLSEEELDEKITAMPEGSTKSVMRTLQRKKEEPKLTQVALPSGPMTAEKINEVGTGGITYEQSDSVVDDWMEDIEKFVTDKGKKHAPAYTKLKSVRPQAVSYHNPDDHWEALTQWMHLVELYVDTIR